MVFHRRFADGALAPRPFVTDKLLNRTLLVLIVAAALSCAWLLGQREGARSAFELASSQQSSEEAQMAIKQLQASLSDAELSLAESIGIVESTAARTLRLQRLLEEQMRINESATADLALYRKLEISDKPRAIEVESLKQDSTRTSALELTLIQWQGRARVEGQAEVSITYGTVASSVNPESSDSHSNPGDLSGNLKVDLEPVNFDFRFFETLTFSMLPMELISSGAGNDQISVPQYVDVRINLADERLKTVDTRFKWADVAQ